MSSSSRLPAVIIVSGIGCVMLRCQLERMTKKYRGVEHMTSYPDICIFVDEEMRSVHRAIDLSSCHLFAPGKGAQSYCRDGAHWCALHWPLP